MGKIFFPIMMIFTPIQKMNNALTKEFGGQGDGINQGQGLPGQGNGKGNMGGGNSP